MVEVGTLTSLRFSCVGRGCPNDNSLSKQTNRNMNELLLRLSDEDLSKVGRLRQEIAALAKKHIEQAKQIAALEV